MPMMNRDLRSADAVSQNPHPQHQRTLELTNEATQEDRFKQDVLLVASSIYRNIEEQVQNRS